MQARSLQRLAVFSSSLSVALLGVVLVQWRPRAGEVSLQRLIDDPRLREEVLARLTDSSAGGWDSHNDPDVGRVLQPNLRAEDGSGDRWSSNAQGMREAPYELPKPLGLVRVVLLGDSFVMGMGCPAEERMGVHLRRLLLERARGAPPAIEVLHIAIGSWNIVAECEYLRRQLSLLQPDLVLHVTVDNDLDDAYGARGFGALARFTTQHRERADALIQANTPITALGRKGTSALMWGVDWEGGTRMQEARARVLRLLEEIEAQGGRYVLVLHWSAAAAACGEKLVQGFDPARLAVLPQEFWEREELWVGPGNAHWNPQGMRLVAELFYGLIQRRALLPALDLPPAPEADEMLALCETRGLELLGRDVGRRWFHAHKIDATIDLANLAEEQPAHFHGGIDAEGRMGPYASLALLGRDARTLVVRGRGLQRAEIDGLRLTIYADEALLAELVVRAGEPFEGRWPLPPGFEQRPAIDARFVADDYVYVGPDLQHCVSTQLEYVALEGP